MGEAVRAVGRKLSAAVSIEALLSDSSLAKHVTVGVHMTATSHGGQCEDAVWRVALREGVHGNSVAGRHAVNNGRGLRASWGGHGHGQLLRFRAGGSEDSKGVHVLAGIRTCSQSDDQFELLTLVVSRCAAPLGLDLATLQLDKGNACFVDLEFEIAHSVSLLNLYPSEVPNQRRRRLWRGSWVAFSFALSLCLTAGHTRRQLLAPLERGVANILIRGDLLARGFAELLRATFAGGRGVTFARRRVAREESWGRSWRLWRGRVRRRARARGFANLFRG
jgi:hypothetical protein